MLKFTFKLQNSLCNTCIIREQYNWLQKCVIFDWYEFSDVFILILLIIKAWISSMNSSLQVETLILLKFHSLFSLHKLHYPCSILHSTKHMIFWALIRDCTFSVYRFLESLNFELEFEVHNKPIYSMFMCRDALMIVDYKTACVLKLHSKC